MFVNLKTWFGFVVLLAMTMPVLSQTPDEIEELANRIHNPLKEKKPSAEEAQEARLRHEAYLKSKPKLSSLLNLKKVKNELELTSSQVAKIVELKNREPAVAPFESGDDFVPDPEKIAEIMIDTMNQSEENARRKADFDAQILGVLLPHQLKRLQQIAIQKQIERAGSAAVILDPENYKVLGISEDQQQNIKKRWDEWSEKLTNQEVKLRKRASEKLLSELTPKQRDAFQKMKGDKFEQVYQFSRRRFKNRRLTVSELIVEDFQKSVIQDAEILSDQLKEIHEINKQHFVDTKELYEGKGEEIREKRLALNNEREAKFEEVLLPHQMKRLQEIITQIHVQNAGEAGALIHADYGELLGITSEQRTRIKSRHKEIGKTLKEDILKLREEANNRVTSLLDSKQRRRFKELVGEKAM